MEELAGINNGIIAFTSYNNTANIPHTRWHCRAWGLYVSIPDFELLHHGVEGDVEGPGGGGTGQPGLTEVELPNIALAGRECLQKYLLY